MEAILGQSAAHPILRICSLLLPLLMASTALASDALEPGGTALTVVVSPPPGDQALARVPTHLLATNRPAAAGKVLFERDWLDARARDGAVLAGPHYDRSSCTACHIETLDDLSARSTEPYLVARPVQAIARERLGSQANTRHANDMAPEANVSIRYTYRTYAYPDGHSRTLRTPHAVATTSGGDRFPVALRAAPLLFGWGLLEHVDQRLLPPFHDPEDANQDGITGRAAIVRDPCTGRRALGLLGWKGTHASLESQISAALQHDMGIESPSPCREDGAVAEFSAKELSAITEFVRHLAVPAHRRDANRRRTDEGERLFGRVGCGDCHVPILLTRDDGPPPLAGQRAWAYTDLMLHDMGADLADPGDGTLAREWRTAPLWGVGLVETRYPQRGFLHDGRAETLEDAILWHGGEARSARARFTALPSTEREMLLDFVRAL
ncbi:MAG: di-heme oxidoredictase family protein [Pseudomonadota bacterium]